MESSDNRSRPWGSVFSVIYSSSHPPYENKGIKVFSLQIKQLLKYFNMLELFSALKRKNFSIIKNYYLNIKDLFGLRVMKNYGATNLTFIILLNFYLQKSP